MLPKNQVETKLEAEILSALRKLDTLESDSEEYGAVLDRVVKLQKMKSDERINLPSLDTALIVGANIFGILWLARYERENVIKAPKAFGFIMKPRG